MASHLPVPLRDGTRCRPWARLAAAVVLAALALLGAGSGAGANEVGQPAAVPLEVLQRGRTDHAALRQARLDLATTKGDIPDERTRRGAQADAFVDRALDRGRALLDRYGSEQLLLAVVVGALVQILGLGLFRLVGTILRLATRVLAWSSGVAIALYLLNGPASLPVSTDEAIGWIGRLSALVDRVA